MLENSGGGGVCYTIDDCLYYIMAAGNGGDRMIDFRELPFHSDDLAELTQLEIDFVFQPIFDAKSLELSAYEALMRPKEKSPLQLIEEYQKKDKLYVIELATCFGAAMEYRKRGYTQDMCINSFPSEVLNDGQSKLYYECFPDMAGRVVVEMVEYTELNKPKWADKKADIEGHHMRLSLDDYSTGNNDMSAVDYFNPQYVKLDRSLISEVHKDKEKQDRIIELVEHFHSIGIRVVAEGIETQDELEYMRNNTDVDFFQGYYLGMPK